MYISSFINTYKKTMEAALMLTSVRNISFKKFKIGETCKDILKRIHIVMLCVDQHFHLVSL